MGPFPESTTGNSDGEWISHTSYIYKWKHFVFPTKQLKFRKSWELPKCQLPLPSTVGWTKNIGCGYSKYSMSQFLNLSLLNSMPCQECYQLLWVSLVWAYQLRGMEYVGVNFTFEKPDKALWHFYTRSYVFQKCSISEFSAHLANVHIIIILPHNVHVWSAGWTASPYISFHVHICISSVYIRMIYMKYIFSYV